jgi:gamma-glutamyltranspeptidase / glutathione hydrolase
MGYTIRQRPPWGAAEVIAVGPARRAGTRSGLFYGANDDRRPAGAAVGY